MLISFLHDCPEHRSKQDAFRNPEPWTDDELVDSFKRLAALGENGFDTCYFIDGLDEYDGDVKELVQFLCDVSQLASNVKICVSSRPLKEVGEVLGGSKWTLTLPDRDS